MGNWNQDAHPVVHGVEGNSFDLDDDLMRLDGWIHFLIGDGCFAWFGYDNSTLCREWVLNGRIQSQNS
jgi:hypothetical protein